MKTRNTTLRKAIKANMMLHKSKRKYSRTQVRSIFFYINTMNATTNCFWENTNNLTRRNINIRSGSLDQGTSWISLSFYLLFCWVCPWFWENQKPKYIFFYTNSPFELLKFKNKVPIKKFKDAFFYPTLLKWKWFIISKPYLIKLLF